MSIHEADNCVHTSLLNLKNIGKLETIAHRSTEHGAAQIVVIIGHLSIHAVLCGFRVAYWVTNLLQVAGLFWLDLCRAANR